MKLEYLSTLDEAVETKILWLKDLNTVNKWRLWGVFYWLGITTLFVALAPGPVEIKIGIGFVLGGLTCGNLVFNAEKLLRRKIRKIILKKTKTFEPAPAVVTLSGSTLDFSSRGVTVEFNLKEIISLQNTQKGLIVNFEKGKLLYLPNAAFTDTDEKDTWVNAINSEHSKHND